jgi:hypothetical protein
MYRSQANRHGDGELLRERSDFSRCGSATLGLTIHSLSGDINTFVVVRQDDHPQELLHFFGPNTVTPTWPDNLQIFS